MTHFSEAIPAVVRHLKDRPAGSISDEEIVQVVDVLRNDERVTSIAFSRREPGGRPLLKVVATDTTAGPGEFAGEFSVGRVIATLSERWMPHALRMEAKWEAEAEMRARIRDRDHQEHLEKEENERTLQRFGISVQELVWISNRLADGRHISDGHMDDWMIYEREVVRGRPKPMKLDLYLPNCTSALR